MPFIQEIVANIIIYMNKVSKPVKSFFYKIDLFGSSEMLRYRSEPQYSTLTGGIISFFIIIAFSTLLFQNLSSVVAMDSVSAQDFTYYVEDPTYTNISFDLSSNFIIGFGISGLNLSDTNRYFDI